jgi:multicomponent Na+:H+ antiporter subunit D
MGTSIGLFLPAILWTQTAAGTLDFVPGGILDGVMDGPAVGLLLALFTFGIAKAAIMPVHRWLPAAMVAPTPVSALLHAVAVVKAGVFSITKVITYIFGIEFLAGQPSAGWLTGLAAFTILGASAVALSQTNLKRMLAYSTISQLSYIIMAAAVLKPLSEIGAAVHMVSHAFGKITLFFAAGAIYVASKKTELYQLHGIGRRMPWTMGAFTIGALSMIGVPPTAGFVSKWYILGGSLEAGNLVAVFTLIGSTVLNAAYFLPIIYRAWWREETVPPARDHGEAPWPMVLALTTTALLTLAFFVYNQPVIDLESQLVGRLK